jgi:hypothetical protein
VNWIGRPAMFVTTLAELAGSVSPVIVGGGNPFLPGDVRLRLELLDERRFGNGVLHSHYRTRT